MAQQETILIIDSQRDSIERLVDQILRPAGYAVSVAQDGQEGLEMALAQDVDLVVASLNLPRLDGLQVLEGIRQADKETPVILTAFHGAESAAVRAYQLGAQAYVIKPYDAALMRNTIERCLAPKRLRKERDALASNLAHMGRQMEHRLREMSVLSSIGKTVTALLDKDRVLTCVVEAAVYITGAEEGFLLLVEPETGELYMRAARGLGEKYARGFRLKVNDSLAGQVVQTGKPVMITPSRNRDRFKLKTGYLVRSLLHVPLRVGDTVIGVLSVDHMIEERTFTNHELYLLSTLADYAAIAIENARLHRELQQQLERERTSQASRIQDVSGPGGNEAAPRAPAGRERLRARVFAGKTLLSELLERLTSLEVWLDGVDSQTALLDGTSSAQLTVLDSPSTAQELTALLDSLEDGVIQVSPDDRIVRANRVAQRILRNELLGRNIDHVCDDARWAKTYRIVKAAARLRPGAPGSGLHSAVTPLIVGQRSLRASFRSSPPSGMVIVIHDITAEREAQRAKDAFVTSLSQELRMPATSIIGYADLLLTRSLGMLTATQAKFIERIRGNADRVGALLNNLVGTAVLDTRQLEIKAEVLNLAVLIEQAAAAMRDQLATKHQTLSVHVDPHLPYVKGGSDALYHVLTTLLYNAHRCSRERAQITLQAQGMQDGKNLYVMASVTDVGGGIALQDQRKVFNRFYRADNPIVPGLGDPAVGLPIVKVLVEAQGGRVWVDSILGVGSTLSFVLPAVQPAGLSLDTAPLG